MKRLFVLLLFVTVSVGVVSPAASATPAGKDGRIAFVSSDLSDEIVTVLSDGTHAKVVTKGNHPSWSPDGKRIAFVRHKKRFDAVLVISANGTGRKRLYGRISKRLSEIAGRPAWSPNGTKMAVCYTDRKTGFGQLLVLNADGSGWKRISPATEDDCYPDWSPDGSRIVFRSFQHGRGKGAIVTMDPDGSHRTVVTSHGVNRYPSWSPDASNIVLSRVVGDSYELFLINPDGSGATQLTHTSGKDELNGVFSPGGRWICYQRSVGRQSLQRYDLWLVDRDGRNAHALIASRGPSEEAPSWQST